MSEISATLEYEGEQYIVHMDWPRDEGRNEEEEAHLARWMWTEGNYGCDCNLFAFISYEYDDYPGEEEYDHKYFSDGKFPCGETVKLVSLMLDGKDLLAPTVNERLAAIGLFSYGGL